MNQNQKDPASSFRNGGAPPPPPRGGGGGGEPVKREHDSEEWNSVDEDDFHELFFGAAPVAAAAAAEELPPPPAGGGRLCMPAHIAAGVASAKTIEDFVRAHYESERIHAENTKEWAIMAPPDKPNLTTVPWQVEMITQQIPNKSELSKRTENSNATTQKKKPGAAPIGKKGKKKK